eukprot:TRINITY_DN6330_c0_g1_i4.p1 TRINITY_DN6330_c0_g1~~TRINITY_DN6330_c0_g1_i4.p1  ORF type:complete len:247 (+),score=48.55 TRINITY_DN6330_c0_g1_i4:134-874(+)
MPSLVGSEMCIRDRYQRRVHGKIKFYCYENMQLKTEPDVSSPQKIEFGSNLKTKLSSVYLYSRSRSKSPLSPSKTILGSIQRGIRENDVNKIISRPKGFLPNINDASNANIFQVDIYKENHIVLTQLQTEYNKLQNENQIQQQIIQDLRKEKKNIAEQYQLLCDKRKYPVTQEVGFVTLKENEKQKVQELLYQLWQYKYVRKRSKDDICLLYTSDAADDMQCVDLGGRRIIKKKKNRRRINRDYAP